MGMFLEFFSPLFTHYLLLTAHRSYDSAPLVESFSEEWQYPTREQQPIEWWKNHFLPQHNEEQANVAIFEGPLNYAKQLGIICGTLWAMLEPHYVGLRN